nr:hypothetical protein [Tanacetum cinerariifolium]
MDNENKIYETCEEEEGYGDEDGFSSTKEYDLEDDCVAKLDDITETLDPHQRYRGCCWYRGEHYEAMIYAHLGIKPTYILDTIKAQVEIEVTRNQCKRAKALVMKRLERDVLNEYKKLNDYAKALVDANPVNSVDIEVEHIGTGIPPHFKRYGEGYAFTAVGKDANNQTFPLAWGIVETESQSSWTWFLEHLKVDIKTKDGGEWTFMSDKQKGLLNVVQAIFPQAEHRLCARYIKCIRIFVVNK